MDMDVECFRSTASFLRGFDVVLNVELGDQVTVTNAVMASIPNATLWRRVFKLLRVIAFCHLPFSLGVSRQGNGHLCSRHPKTLEAQPDDKCLTVKTCRPCRQEK